MTSGDQNFMAVSSKEPFEHGSRWIRADFHLHTRADKEFSYLEISDEERNAFISRYVAGLAAADIELGVITNHNKFDFDEFKALRKAARKRGIYLLPGVELSVNDGANGIHLLVVFSEAWIENGHDYITQFLNAAFLGKVPAHYENENGRSNDGLIEALKKLEIFQRDFFVIHAHVEQKSGLWEEIDGGRLTELGQQELFVRYTLGFQKVRTADRRNKVMQWLKDAYPAELEGSDPKSIDDIGKGPACYLKLGDFNFEAVKLALMDHVSRVSLSAVPVTQHSWVSALRFEGGLLDGRRVCLSSALNCLIGIRGSGKSSLLEALRYGLDIPFGQKSQDREYKEKLIPHLLASGGKVVVEATSRHGQAYEIHRIWNEQPEVRVGGVVSPGIAILDTVLKKPLYFGQKDLSATGEGFGQDLVEKLVGGRLRGVRERIASQCQRVIATIEQLNKLGEQKEKLVDCQSQQKDIEHRLSLYREYGIEDKLQQQLAFDRDLRHCDVAQDLLGRWNQSLSSALQEFEDDLVNIPRYASVINSSFFEDYFSAYSSVLKGVAAIKAVIAENGTAAVDMAEKASRLAKVKIGLKDEFAAIERALALQLQNQGAAAINAEEFKQLSLRHSRVKSLLDALHKSLDRAKAAEKALLVERSMLNDLWLEEFRLIQQALSEINEGQDALRVEVEFKGGKAAMVALLKDLFRGSGLKESSYQQIAAAYADFMEIYRDLDMAAATAGARSHVFVEYFERNIRELLPWQVPNTYRVMFHGKPLQDHSLGQRASAMMLFILSQKDNDLLLIDQPEDDLDNQTLYTDVIRLVRQLKPGMQFIFATHNANIPVLGDAEQVLVCDSQAGAMRVNAGSVDSRAIQRAIVDIMEGGNEAFNKRKEIYQLWKTLNS